MMKQETTTTDLAKYWSTPMYLQCIRPGHIVRIVTPGSDSHGCVFLWYEPFSFPALSAFPVFLVLGLRPVANLCG